MPDQNLCEIVVVLDRSGSMATVKNDMEGGFNRFVTEQKSVPGACAMTLVQFDTQGIDTVYENKPIADVPTLHLAPRGGTPLLDAMGETITKVGERFGRTAEDKRPGKVIVLVVTDGEENSSHRYTKEQIKRMVEVQSDTYKWQFVYLGANVDAFAEAGSIGISALRSSSYTPDSAGVGGVFTAMSASVGQYRCANEQSATLTLTDEQRKQMGGKLSA